jgi:hypothetical protein
VLTPLELYLGEIARVRATGAGTAETSYYSALQSAFNSVGSHLKPKVFCVSQLANRRGAGHPDFGLFSQEQLPRGGLANWTEALEIPARGVVEAKGVEADLEKTLRSQQVQDYLAAYGLVLVTNYREFILWAVMAEVAAKFESGSHSVLMAPVFLH